MMMKWISIKDKLPEIGTSVLTCNMDGGCLDERAPIIGFVDDVDNSKWYQPWTKKPLTPTHWVQLPELPEDEKCFYPCEHKNRDNECVINRGEHCPQPLEEE